jgi:hypothetical protein
VRRTDYRTIELEHGRIVFDSTQTSSVTGAPRRAAPTAGDFA